MKKTTLIVIRAMAKATYHHCLKEDDSYLYIHTYFEECMKYLYGLSVFVGHVHTLFECLLYIYCIIVFVYVCMYRYYASRPRFLKATCF